MSDQSRTDADQNDGLRRRALQLMRRRPGDAGDPAGMDLDALIYELQIHQAELEAQNEELRRARDEVERSRRQYLDLYEWAPVGYFAFDRQGLIRSANLTGAAMLRVERDRLMGVPFRTFLAEPDAARWFAHLSTVIDLRAGGVEQLRLKRGDGTCFWARLDSMPVERQADGPVVECRCAITDISESREAQEALRRNEAKYRGIVEQSQDGIVLVDEEGRIIEWNRGMEAIYGLTADGALGRPIWDVQLQLSVEEERTPQQHELMRRAMLQFLATGTAEWTGRMMEREVQRLDGRRIAVQMVMFGMRSDLGYRAGAITRDTTESRRQAEAIEAERERLAATLRSIVEGVIATDADGRVLLMNATAERLTGWPEAEAVGQPVTEVFHTVDEMTGVRIEPPVRRVLESGEPETPGRDVRLIGRDGGEVMVATNAAPLRGPRGVSGAVLVCRDVTEERKLERSVANASKLEAVGLLAGGIAHDFNNLLTAIIGNIALSRLEAEPGSDVAEMLSEAERASHRAKELTRQLLTFARGGAPVRRAASLTEVLTESSVFALRGSKSTCRIEAAPDLMAVEMDEGQISQVIQNLIINADEAMPAGGTVLIRAENVELTGAEGLPLPVGKYVRLSVTDQGVGIAGENLEKVFDPYFTTKQKGSGLGLATTYSIVRAHEGHISVESRPGRGTTFTIHLPASEGAVAARGVAAKALEVGTGRLLLMDDELVVREVLKRIVMRLGYEAEVVADGTAAVRAYEEAAAEGRPFAAAIMDLTVPGGMGGVEAVELLRRTHPEAKVIVSSGYSNDPVLSSYREYGFDGVAVKPFRIEDLGAELARVLREEE